MHSKAFLCLAFGFLVVVNGQDPTTVPTTSAPPTTPTTTPSTTTPTTTPSTTAPTTTPSTTTPTTTSPTTPSTTTAQTTTKATTTSTAAPTTSTAAPTTTTPKPTTPTPTPTPKPLPTPPPPPSVEVGTWNVTKNGTEMCLKAQFGLLLLVPYVTTDGRTVNGSVAVPPSATAAGDCSSLMLVWGGNSSSNFVTMKFEQITPVNKTKPEFRLQQITATLAHDAERFPNATDESAFSITLQNAAEVFEAPVNSSYRCHSEQQFRANSTVPAPAPVNGTIPATVFLFKELQLQPFMAGASTGFGSATTCAADRELTSDVVPIAVGCALAGLVVVVIVAYIIGRRRSRQNGYTSV